MAGHDHPLFTRVYRVLVRLEDSGSVGRARTEAAEHLGGRLLVVGLGPAEDLHHLPASVTEVVAVEPSASMREAAQPFVEMAEESGMPVEVVDAVGEALPLPDESVDSVLLAYVLCTVDEPGRVLAEVDRVLRPGGPVGVLEHVAGAPGSWTRRTQRVVSPLWPRIAGGCRCDRDTRAVLDASGFDTAGLREATLVNVPPVAPALIGTAWRAGERPNVG